MQMRSNRHGRLAALIAAALAALTLATAAVARVGDDGDGHAMAHETEPAPAGMAVAVKAWPSKKGVVVRVLTKGFRFAPAHLDGKPVPREGHAHLYVDGVKVTVLLGPWLYVGGLKPGKHTLRVTLNANNHADYARNGKVIEARTTVVAPKPPAM